MGQPIPFACASPACQAVHSPAVEGTFFSAQQIFVKKLSGPSTQASLSYVYTLDQSMWAVYTFLMLKLLHLMKQRVFISSK